VAPANLTIACDYDKNGIIGNLSSFQQTGTNIAVYVNNNPLNLSRVFNTTSLIEFREGNIARVMFTYNFLQPLNFKNIRIIKQANSSNFGYIIFNGINISKTFTVDRINSGSNRVCVKNRYVANISELSNSCDDIGEHIVNCPGSHGQFSCNLSNNKFIVSGLTESAVREFIQSSVTVNCTPSWSCSDWSFCVRGVQMRTCRDINNCHSNESKPETNKTCTPIARTCVPSWNCTEWQPAECPKNQTQSRKCLDLNKCRVNVNKPEEVQACVREPKSSGAIILMSVLLLIIGGGIIVFIIILYVSKGDISDAQIEVSVQASNRQQIQEAESTEPEQEQTMEQGDAVPGFG
jgi:hypothetical protein